MVLCIDQDFSSLLPLLSCGLLIFSRACDLNVLILCLDIFGDRLAQRVDIGDDRIIEVAQLYHIVRESCVEAFLRLAFPHRTQCSLCLLEGLDHAVEGCIELLKFICLGGKLVNCHIEFCHGIIIILKCV